MHSQLSLCALMALIFDCRVLTEKMTQIEFGCRLRTEAALPLLGKDLTVKAHRPS